MTEKSYKRQRAIIIAIIAVTAVLIVIATVGIIISSTGAKPFPSDGGMVTVGNYVGKNYADIEDDSLTFEKVEVFSNEGKGIVTEQSVAEGTSVKKGTVITLNVSKGDSEVEVPSVVGWTEEEALKNLKDNGFEVNVHYIVNYEGLEKEFVVQSCVPDVGTKVSYGSKVTLVVWGDDNSTPTTTTQADQSTSSTTKPSTQQTTQPTTAPTTQQTTTEPTTQQTTTEPTTAPTTAAPVVEQTTATPDEVAVEA